MGRHEGLQDSQGRGQNIFRSMKAVVTKKPRAFLLENVKGPSVLPPGSCAYDLARLRAIGGGIYDVGHRVLDTAKKRFAPAP